jgi:hypothetical protein
MAYAAVAEAVGRRREAIVTAQADSIAATAGQLG